jgi:hypothetical protein
MHNQIDNTTVIPKMQVHITRSQIASGILCQGWINSLNRSWWGTDIVLAALISVFTPIPVLRNALIWFFDMILFNRYAAVRIICCLVLSAAIYARLLSISSLGVLLTASLCPVVK